MVGTSVDGEEAVLRGVKAFPDVYWESQVDDTHMQAARSVIQTLKVNTQTSSSLVFTQIISSVADPDLFFTDPDPGSLSAQFLPMDRIMIFFLFNRQIFPIILDWRTFWILVVHISLSVVSRSVALVLTVQLH